MIRFDRIRAHNMGVFKDLDIDFAAIEGPIVAIVGDNGAGKSTALDMLSGALFRDTPTRGTLMDLATARDSWLEVSAVNGHAWKIRHDLDTVSGKGECLVTGDDGAPALPDTKVKFFDAWAKTHLPAPEVLYASTVASQGSGGFLDLKEGPRKAVLLRVLGVERLEGQAKRARDLAAEAKAELVTLDARISDERARSGDVDAARAALTTAEAAVTTAEAALVVAKEELRGWEAERVLLDAAQLEARRHEERAAGIRSRIAAEETALADITTRLANNRAALAQEAEVRAAVARRAAIATEIATLERLIADAQSSHREAVSACNAAAAALTSAENAARGAKQRSAGIAARVGEAEKRLAEGPAILAAVEGAKVAEAARDTARETVAAMEADLEGLRGQRVMGAEGRVVELRGALQCVKNDPPDANTIATQALERDDETVTLAASLPGRTRSAEAALLAAKRTLSAAEEALAVAQRTAARAPLLAQAEADLAAARTQAEASLGEEYDADLATTEARSTFETAARAKDAAAGQDAPHVAAKGKLEAEAKSLEALAGTLARVEAAAGRIAELEPQVAAGTARIEALRGELALVPTPAARAALRSSPDVGAAERTLTTAQGAATLARAAVTRAEEGTKLVAARLEERAKVFADMEDWTLLADSLGRDGIQAAEIDAAGPELTALINDLLHTCIGSRWTVTVDTQKASSDGKKTLEGLEVRVLDTEAGREAPAETLSGGERVIVGEAVSLALTMLACRRSGVVRPTIIRDETGAALSPENSRAYMDMWRRAVDITGASHLLFVTHNDEMKARADARILVGGGTAVVS